MVDRTGNEPSKSWDERQHDRTEWWLARSVLSSKDMKRNNVLHIRLPFGLGRVGKSKYPDRLRPSEHRVHGRSWSSQSVLMVTSNSWTTPRYDRFHDRFWIREYEVVGQSKGLECRRKARWQWCCPRWTITLRDYALVWACVCTGSDSQSTAGFCRVLLYCDSTVLLPGDVIVWRQH
jgi:hypothetical protein